LWYPKSLVVRFHGFCVKFGQFELTNNGISSIQIRVMERIFEEPLTDRN